jgi:methyl coenzyme M reductase beta subunit
LAVAAAVTLTAAAAVVAVIVAVAQTVMFADAPVWEIWVLNKYPTHMCNSHNLLWYVVQ